MEDEPKMKTSKKGLLQTEELYEYILETSVYPREPEPLKELRAVTASHPLALMATAPDAGQLIALLLKQLNAKKTIEIGVFTGYSLLLTALTIPDDGQITAIDRNQSAYKIGLPIIKKAGVEHKIRFIESDALPALDELLQHSPFSPSLSPKRKKEKRKHVYVHAPKIRFIESDALPALDELLQHHENVGSFEFAFVDADKINYSKYHEKLLKLLKPGGIIVYDNTLWLGTVAMPEESVPEGKREGRHHTIEFNKFLAADSRVDISHVPLGDGITVCRIL